MSIRNKRENSLFMSAQLEKSQLMAASQVANPNERLQLAIGNINRAKWQQESSSQSLASRTWKASEQSHLQASIDGARMGLATTTPLQSGAQASGVSQADFTKSLMKEVQQPVSSFSTNVLTSYNNRKISKYKQHAGVEIKALPSQAASKREEGGNTFGKHSNSLAAQAALNLGVKLKTANQHKRIVSYQTVNHDNLQSQKEKRGDISISDHLTSSAERMYQIVDQEKLSRFINEERESLSKGLLGLPMLSSRSNRRNMLLSQPVQEMSHSISSAWNTNAGNSLPALTESITGSLTARNQGQNHSQSTSSRQNKLGQRLFLTKVDFRSPRDQKQVVMIKQTNIGSDKLSMRKKLLAARAVNGQVESHQTHPKVEKCSSNAVPIQIQAPLPPTFKSNAAKDLSARLGKQLKIMLLESEERKDPYRLPEKEDRVIEILQARIDRKKGRITRVDTGIDAIVSELVKSGSKIAPDVLKKDIKRFIKQRELQDAVANGQKRAVEQTSCKILQKSVTFLNQGSKSQNSEVPCKHGLVEEEQHLLYLEEYKRFSSFRMLLYRQLQARITNELLIESILKDFDRLQLTQEEMVLFRSEEAIQNILANPLLEIALSASEIKHVEDEIVQQTQQN